MSKTLVFLHTSPVHIATFDGLLATMDADVSVRHIVDEGLLSTARSDGITPALAERIRTHILAVGQYDVVLCTCSTIGGCAEYAGAVRVDRAMAERAVAAGPRILLVAALASTLVPTRRLIEQVAAASGQPISIRELLCEAAWASFEAGDQPAYLAQIAAAVRASADYADVIVLAQASMAGAAALCPELAIPLFSSPRLGLEVALRQFGVV